jgi:ABC-type transport system substrate-binding protein
MQNPNHGSFLPYAIQYHNDAQLIDLVYDTLVSANHAGNLYPRLAESWKTEDRGYLFTLRSGIRFHNGKPFTVDDVFFTLERLVVNTHQQYKEIFCVEGVEDFLAGRTDTITGLEKIDDLRFRIKLGKKFNYFLHFLSAKFTAILPEGFAGETAESFNRAPIGTGPFIFKGLTEEIIKHRPFLRYHFEKNEQHPCRSGNVDRINFHIPRAREKLRTLLFFDLFFQDINFDTDEVKSLPRRRIINTPPDIISYLSLAITTDPVVRDARLRRQINHGINRERILKSMNQTSHFPAHSIIPASMFGHNPYYRIHYKQPGERQTAAGPQGAILTLLIHPAQMKLAVRIRDELAPFGIKVVFNEISAEAYYQMMSSEIPPHTVIVEGVPDYPASYNFLYQLYEPDGLLNYFKLDSPQILQLIHKLPELDVKEQAVTLPHINELVERESIYIPLYYYGDSIIIKDRIKKIIFKYAGVIDFSSIEVEDEHIH